MELPYDLSEYFSDQPIQRLDQCTLRKLNPRKCCLVEQAINSMGTLSATAQGLRRVLTTYNKLVDSDEGQVLYLMWRMNPNNNLSSTIVGMLKIGYKKLYLMDGEMHALQSVPLCILDFYVHETLQRKGFGHELFDYMLQQENGSAGNVAIDKPSESLLQFMKKHYGLDCPLWQSTNYVVYPPFFECHKTIEDEHEAVDEQYSQKTIAVNGSSQQVDTPQPGRDSFMELLRDNASADSNLAVDPDTAQGRKINRDFGHHTIW